MFFKATQKVIDILIVELRTFFRDYGAANPDNVFYGIEKFRWSADVNKTKVFVFDQYPEEDRYFPCIVISGTPASSAEIGFGQFIGSQDGVDKYGGHFRLNIGITIAAQSTVEARTLADMVIGMLLFTLRNRLEVQGITPIPPSFISISPLTFNHITLFDQHIWQAILTYPVLVTWQECVTPIPIEDVKFLEGVKVFPYIDIRLLYKSSFDEYIDGAFPLGWNQTTFVLDQGIALTVITTEASLQKISAGSKRSVFTIQGSSGQDSWFGKYVELSDLLLENQVEISCDIRTRAGLDDLDESEFAAGIVLYKDQDNYYLMGLKRTSIDNRYWYWAKKEEGVWSEHDVIEQQEWEPLTWYNLRLTYTGTTLVLYVNNVKEEKINVSLFSDYRVGLYAGAKSAIDDSKIDFNKIVINELLYRQE
ncbi:MAG: hypothetical protein KJ760_19175 [Proteobacteria bacterium]|nr:hypothetical protein [Pseudomonadota bacterium]